MLKLITKSQRLLPLYSRQVEPVAITDIGASVRLPEGYHAANPAILRYGNGYLACIRGVNYLMENPRSLVPTFTAGTRFHTVNRFVVLDRELQATRPLAQIETILEAAGTEDIRLFSHDNRIFGIASLAGAKTPVASMCLMVFAADLTDVELIPLKSPFGLRAEKNWCPFSHDGRIAFFYSFSPDTFVVLDLARHEVRVLPAGGGAKRQREELRFWDCGSTPGQQYGEGHVFLAHRRSVRLPGARYVYSSRLYSVSADLQRVRRGDYFTLGEPSIQFISGLQMEKDQVLVSYGLNDRQALVARLDREEFISLLPSH